MPLSLWVKLACNLSSQNCHSMLRLFVVFLAPLLISAEGNEQEDCLAAAVQKEGS